MNPIVSLPRIECSTGLWALGGRIGGVGVGVGGAPPPTEPPTGGVVGWVTRSVLVVIRCQLSFVELPPCRRSRLFLDC